MFPVKKIKTYVGFEKPDSIVVNHFLVNFCRLLWGSNFSWRLIIRVDIFTRNIKKKNVFCEKLEFSA